METLTIKMNVHLGANKSHGIVNLHDPETRQKEILNFLKICVKVAENWFDLFTYLPQFNCN